MRTKSLPVFGIALMVSVSMLFPLDLLAQNQPQSQAARGAGKVSRMIPAVNLQRGAKLVPAASSMAVLWGDTLTTDRGGRARVALDDGSILNVGSDSSIHVVSHDAANQRTQIQLAYGRMRSSAVRLARAGSSFEVRTPTAVAGVVGTDFFLEFMNNVTRMVVFEGKVNFCNLGGECVVVGAGMLSLVRGNQQPSPPSPAPPSAMVSASNTSSVGSGGAVGSTVGVTGGALAGHGLLVAVGVVAAAIIPAVAVGSVVNRTRKCGCNGVVRGHP